MGGGDSTKAIKIDIAKLESSLQNLTSPEHSYRAFESCIFKTPNILLRHNPNAYTPDAFSIGPMHHGKRNLKAAQKIKTLYLREFLHRSSVTLTTVTEVVEKREAEARACYAEGVNFTREKLVEILVVDGCFLIELLYRSGLDTDPDHPNNPIRTKACMLQYLYHDLMLLENQIPWIVLDDLFNNTIKHGPNNLTLEKLVTCFFRHQFSTRNPLSDPDPNYKCKHILDLVRESLVSRFNNQEKAKNWKRTPSAVAQSEAGVKLVRKENQTSILDVRFDNVNGWLEIPHVLIMETTETMFRNLISYEQCYPGCEPIVTSYVILMDNLVDRSEDLKKLSEEEIVDNWLDPQEATKLFNSLYSDANVTGFCYFKLSLDVDTYCKKKWPKWKAWYRHNYFTQPWAIVSQVGALIILILTILQTVFTIHK